MTDLNLKNSLMKTRSTQRSKKAQVPFNQVKIYKNNREKVCVFAFQSPPIQFKQ